MTLGVVVIRELAITKVTLQNTNIMLKVTPPIQAAFKFLDMEISSKISHKIASKYRENGPGSGSAAAILPPGARRGEDLIEIKQTKSRKQGQINRDTNGKKIRKMVYLNLRF